MAIRASGEKPSVHIVAKNCPPSRIEVRPTALLRYHSKTCWTLTFDLYFQSQVSYGRDHIHNTLNFKSQSVQKIEWKQTDGQTARRTQPNALPSRLTRMVTRP